MKNRLCRVSRWTCRSRFIFGCALLATWFCCRVSAQQMIHRYSFDGDVRDLIGGADAELVGDATLNNGAVNLSGNKPSYVNLPNDLFVSLTNATFEIWVTWNGGPVWQRIWDFGNNDNAEDIQGAATQSIFLTPNNGGGMDLSIFPNGIAGQQVVTAPALPIGGLHQIAWTYDASTKQSILYIDGVQVGINNNMTYHLADLGSTVNNWLGHSQYIQDVDFSGAVAEFRIYDGALSASAVAADFNTGPDPTGRGLLNSIILTAGPTLRPGGSQQVRVTADYQNVSNLDITVETGVTYQLSNTNVLSISAGGLLTSVGTNSATATVTAAYQGKNSRLFVDGVENGSNNSMTYKLTDLTPLSNVGLGHSQYIQDADFAGAIAEFRIYRGTFLDAEVAADFAACPDDLPGETASRRLAVSFDAGKIAVSWPATTTGFALERSATLGTGVNWTPVTVDSANRVTVDATGAGAFYRLRKLP